MTMTNHCQWQFSGSCERRLTDPAAKYCAEHHAVVVAAGEKALADAPSKGSGVVGPLAGAAVGIVATTALQKTTEKLVDRAIPIAASDSMLESSAPHGAAQTVSATGFGIVPVLVTAVVGASTGAILAYGWSLRHPPDCVSVVAEDPGPDQSPDAAQHHTDTKTQSSGNSEHPVLGGAIVSPTLRDDATSAAAVERPPDSSSSPPETQSPVAKHAAAAIPRAGDERGTEQVSEPRVADPAESGPSHDESKRSDCVVLRAPTLKSREPHESIYDIRAEWVACDDTRDMTSVKRGLADRKGSIGGVSVFADITLCEGLEKRAPATTAKTLSSLATRIQQQINKSLQRGTPIDIDQVYETHLGGNQTLVPGAESSCASPSSP